MTNDQHATKQDLKIQVNKLDKKIDAVHDKLDKKIDAVHDKLDKKIDAVHDKLDKKIDAVHGKLDKKIDTLGRVLRVEIQINKKEIIEEVNAQSRKYRDQILNYIDAFAKEIKDNGEDRTITAHQLSNHEDRLQRVEDHLSLPALV